MTRAWTGMMVIGASLFRAKVGSVRTLVSRGNFTSWEPTLRNTENVVHELEKCRLRAGYTGRRMFFVGSFFFINVYWLIYFFIFVDGADVERGLSVYFFLLFLLLSSLSRISWLVFACRESWLDRNELGIVSSQTEEERGRKKTSRCGGLGGGWNWRDFFCLFIKIPSYSAFFVCFPSVFLCVFYGSASSLKPLPGGWCTF